MWISVEGVRLQPLICLNSGEQIGQEVLAMLSPGLDPESFFRSFSYDVCMLQFFDQVDFITQKKLPGLSFLNLPARVLGDEGCVRRLNQLRPCYRQDLVIEIQDPVEMIIADDRSLEAMSTGISYLRYSGWKIWLDDLTAGICGVLNQRRLRFDGVKIDRKEIRRHKQPEPGVYAQKPLSGVVNQAQELVIAGKNNVLIEGVETLADLEYARKSGARWGQGYLWPETQIRFR